MREVTHVSGHIALRRVFQPTPPVREATVPRRTSLLIGEISTHTSRAGGDLAERTKAAQEILFQPTPPVREATEIACGKPKYTNISTHTSRAGGDDIVFIQQQDMVISTHTSRAGGDPVPAI